jgi:hypothetical protein
MIEERFKEKDQKKSNKWNTPYLEEMKDYNASNIY